MTARLERHVRVGVGAIIADLKGDILLLGSQSAGTEGPWSVPGGALEIGENPEQAMKREVLEETGLSVRAFRFLGYLDFRESGQHWVSLVFHVYSYSGRIRFLEDEPFDRAEWFPANKLPPLNPISQMTFLHLDADMSWRNDV